MTFLTFSKSSSFFTSTSIESFFLDILFTFAHASSETREAMRSSHVSQSREYRGSLIFIFIICRYYTTFLKIFKYFIYHTNMKNVWDVFSRILRGKE